MKTILKYLLLSMPLAACGGGSVTPPVVEFGPPHGITTPVPDIPPEDVLTRKKIDYSHLKDTGLEPEYLRQASSQELSDLIKNGLRVSLNDRRVMFEMMPKGAVGVGRVMAAPVAAGAAKEILPSGNFSGTNIQVSGVDEADDVKYDGHYIYSLDNTIPSYVSVDATPFSSGYPKRQLKIFETDSATAAVKEISSIDVDSVKYGDATNLYLASAAQPAGGIITVGSSVESASINANARAPQFFTYYFMGMPINHVDVSFYDVSNPATPKKSWALTLDGELISSRKINDTLYIVSRFEPRLSTLNYAAQTDDERLANEKLIENATIETLLPSYSFDDRNRQSLHASSDCLIPVGTKVDDAHLQLINVTAVNIKSKEIVKSICVDASVEGVYSSLDSLYLGGSQSTQWSNWNGYTVVHKFSLANADITYQASGTVQGVLGWQQTSFRMDEYNNNLRIVTTSRDENWMPTHHLTVLQKVEGRSELEVVSRLPNESYPESIGKLGEDIYSVRFNGSKAYIVTFKNIDPLYVLDLSIPAEPKVAGALEIPGFSTYLHPIGDNYLFSMGREANAMTGSSEIKLSLFDIHDMSAPTLVKSFKFSNSSTSFGADADVNNPHVLSFLQSSDDQLRITFPTASYEETSVDFFSSEPSKTFFSMNAQLHLFEINGLRDNHASLKKVGMLEGENIQSDDYPLWNSVQRGIMHDNSIFYVYGKNVMGKMWPATK